MWLYSSLCCSLVHLVEIKCMYFCLPTILLKIPYISCIGFSYNIRYLHEKNDRTKY